MQREDILHILRHDLKIEHNSASVMINYIIDDMNNNREQDIKHNLELVKISYLRLTDVIDTLLKDLE